MCSTRLRQRPALCSSSSARGVLEREGDVAQDRRGLARGMGSLDDAARPICARSVSPSTNGIHRKAGHRRSRRRARGRCAGPASARGASLRGRIGRRSGPGRAPAPATFTTTRRPSATSSAVNDLDVPASTLIGYADQADRADGADRSVDTRRPHAGGMIVGNCLLGTVASPSAVPVSFARCARSRPGHGPIRSIRRIRPIRIAQRR